MGSRAMIGQFSEDVLDLHIEQGGSLDRENIQVGVVDGIVGFRVWD